MQDNFIYPFFIVLIVLNLALITWKHLKSKKRSSRLIAGSYRRLNVYLVSGFIWCILFFIWIYLLIERTGDIYLLLAKDNISWLQLFDWKYLKAMQQYYYENEMLSELARIAFYNRSLLLNISWLVVSGCAAVSGIYLGLERDGVYKDGFLITSQFIKWDKVTGYIWGEYQEKRWWNKEYQFFDLYIMKEHSKLAAKFLHEKEEKLKIKIKATEQETVAALLEEKVPSIQKV